MGENQLQARKSAERRLMDSNQKLVSTAAMPSISSTSPPADTQLTTSGVALMESRLVLPDFNRKRPVAQEFAENDSIYRPIVE